MSQFRRQYLWQYERDFHETPPKNCLKLLCYYVHQVSLRSEIVASLKKLVSNVITIVQSTRGVLFFVFLKAKGIYLTNQGRVGKGPESRLVLVLDTHAF